MAGIDEENHDMKPFSGEKVGILFLKILEIPAREHMIIGKERHDVGRENDEGYPVRGIVKGNYFYSQNFKPHRWPRWKSRNRIPKHRRQPY